MASTARTDQAETENAGLQPMVLDVSANTRLAAL